MTSVLEKSNVDERDRRRTASGERRLSETIDVIDIDPLLLATENVTKCRMKAERRKEVPGTDLVDRVRMVQATLSVSYTHLDVYKRQDLEIPTTL